MGDEDHEGASSEAPLKLVFLHFGASDRDMAERMIASVKHHMPGLPIVQATDEYTPLLPGVDAVRRIARGASPFPVYRARHDVGFSEREHEGGLILCDDDIIFRADVRNLFEWKFDVMLTRREDERPWKDQPYVGGFMLSRCRAFWLDVQREIAMKEPATVSWFSGQIAIAKVVSRENYRVAEVPESVYNRAPMKPGDACPGAKVVHYRGIRKTWASSSPSPTATTPTTSPTR